MKSFRAFVSLLIFSVLGVAIAQNFDLPLSPSEFGTGFNFPVAGPNPANDGLLVSVFDKPTPETRRDLLTIQQATIDVSKKVVPCTVGLVIQGPEGIDMGSGVVISEDGHILTAAHVVSEPGRNITVLFPDGRTAKGKSLGMHTLADGALAKITEEGPWPFVPLAPKEHSPEPGDWCLAVGHPGGFDIDRTPPVRLGRVIDVRSTVMRTDCPIMGGDSGGPLFDLQGRVIGIHSRIAAKPTENYHVPSNAFHEAWAPMMDGKIYPKPIPSKFLAMLDKDNDGMLRRDEMRSSYHKRVFDRLVEEFDLEEADEYSIKSLATRTLKWRSDIRQSIVEIEDVRDFSSYVLTSNDFVRGPMMEELVTKSLKQVEPGGRSSNVSALAVRVYADGRRVALGTVMETDGLVLTKASRLEHEDIECRMADGTRRPAKIVARDKEYDLALLQVAANNLTVPVWNLSTLKPGQMVVVPHNGDDLESIGVVSVLPRKIEVSPAKMGVMIDATVISEARVEYVAPRSGAERAGIQRGDAFIRVDGQRVFSIKDMLKILEDYRAGDEISVVIRRKNEEIELTVGLLSATEVYFSMRGANSMRMKGHLSRVRDGFGAAVQIDAIVSPQFCGGPVVDLNGEMVGVTLARASRVASYAISSKDLQPVFERLRSQANSITTTRLDADETKTQK